MSVAILFLKMTTCTDYVVLLSCSWLTFPCLGITYLLRHDWVSVIFETLLWLTCNIPDIWLQQWILTSFSSISKLPFLNICQKVVLIFLKDIWMCS